MDVWDSAPSTNEDRFYLLIVDEFSRFFRFLFSLKSKDKVFETFKNFQIMIEKSLGYSIKCLQTDEGEGFCNHRFTKLCKKLGMIIHTHHNRIG